MLVGQELVVADAAQRNDSSCSEKWARPKVSRLLPEQPEFRRGRGSGEQVVSVQMLCFESLSTLVDDYFVVLSLQEEALC